MADLDFTHRVSEVPSGAELPGALPRSERAQVTPVPNIQGVVSNYAEATNWMSSVGSAVATRASTAIATKLGYEAGKQPHGDIFALTDFDKTFAESYKTQAQATLSLQANKLITESNLEMAKSPRISPELIAKTNAQISIGLQNIFKDAPVEARSKLEYQYQTLQLSQAEQLTTRMISEQRQDQRDNLIASNKQNNELASNLARSGNMDAAMSVVKSTNSANDSGWNSRIIQKETSEAAKESVLKSAQAGQAIYEYDKAKAQGKGEQYLADFHNKKGYTPDQIDSMANALVTHVSQENSLNSQQQQLTLAQMKFAMTDGSINDGMWANAKETLTGTQFANLQTEFINFTNKNNNATNRSNQLIKVFNDPTHFGEYTEKEQTIAFNKTADAFVKKQESMGKSVSLEEAEAQVAATAGGPIQSYVKKLSNMAQSVDPHSLDQFGAIVELIDSHNKGENLRGLADKDLAVWDMYNRLNQAGGDKLTNAQLAHEKVYNMDRDQQAANDTGWANYISSKRNKLESSGATAIRLADIPTSSSYNLPLLAADTEAFLKTYFYASNGDTKTAESLTKKAIANKYGTAYYNGREEFLANPINKFVNIPEDGNGIIHNDVAEQINKQFLQTNQAYFHGKSDFWWEVRPGISTDQAIHAKQELDKARKTEAIDPNTSALYRSGILGNFGLVGKALESLAPEDKKAAEAHNANQEILDNFNYGAPPQVIKHYRDGRREQSEISIVASPVTGRDDKNKIVGGWYVNLKTPTGTMPIALTDPLSGPIRYMPDANKIQTQYIAVNGMSALQTRNRLYRDMVLSIAKTKLFGPLRANVEAPEYVK